MGLSQGVHALGLQQREAWRYLATRTGWPQAASAAYQVTQTHGAWLPAGVGYGRVGTEDTEGHPALSPWGKGVT